MNWDAIQEWAELQGEELAFIVSNGYPTGATLEDATRFHLASNSPAFCNPERTIEEKEVMVAAVAWKAALILSTEYKDLANGWETTYINELKRIFEGEQNETAR